MPPSEMKRKMRASTSASVKFSTVTARGLKSFSAFIRCAPHLVVDASLRAPLKADSMRRGLARCCADTRLGAARGTGVGRWVARLRLRVGLQSSPDFDRLGRRVEHRRAHARAAQHQLRSVEGEIPQLGRRASPSRVWPAANSASMDARSGYAHGATTGHGSGGSLRASDGRRLDGEPVMRWPEPSSHRFSVGRYVVQVVDPQGHAQHRLARVLWPDPAIGLDAVAARRAGAGWRRHVRRPTPLRNSTQHHTSSAVETAVVTPTESHGATSAWPRTP